MLHSTPTKICTQCGEYKPATTEYFYIERRASSGLCAMCKTCVGKRNAKYRASNPEVSRRYLAKNFEKVKERNQRRYKDKHEDVIRVKREYAAKNRDRIRAWQKKYKQANPDVGKAADQRRRARKVNKPDTFTPEQWQHCLDYFKGCCAVCERPMNGFFHRPHADHWVALSDPDSPGTIATNMVCLCGGRDGCNESKGHKHPDLWLTEKFGKRKAKQIAKRIQAYFDSLIE